MCSWNLCIDLILLENRYLRKQYTSCINLLYERFTSQLFSNKCLKLVERFSVLAICVDIIQNCYFICLFLEYPLPLLTVTLVFHTLPHPTSPYQNLLLMNIFFTYFIVAHFANNCNKFLIIPYVLDRQTYFHHFLALWSMYSANLWLDFIFQATGI